MLSLFLGLLFVFVLLPWTSMVWAIASTPLQASTFELELHSKIPKSTALALKLMHDDLTALGFTYLHSVKRQTGEEITFFHVYTHPTQTTLAYVESGSDISSICPISIAFLSQRLSGEIILSVNALLHRCPTFALHVLPGDAKANSLSAHWAYHQARLKGEALVRSHSMLATACLTMYQNLFEDWCTQGWVRIHPKTKQGFIPLARAIRLATRALIGHYKIRIQYHLDTKRDVSRELAAAEALVVNKTEEIKAARQTPLTLNILLFSLTGTLALLAFAGLFDWDFAWALLCVIAVHEGGHYLAMRLVGYQNVNVFFIPFFGGATTGHKDNASTLEQVCVYLAGPALGLLTACGCAFLNGQNLLPGPSAFWLNFCVLSFIVNFFNLLPLLPLDGGRVIEVSLLSRYPRIQVAFLIVGALLLLVAGVLDENYWLGGLALFMLLGYPHYLRASQLIRQVRAKMTSKGLSAIPRRTAINSCFNGLFLETKAKLTPAQRIQAVKLTVPALIRAPASWKQIFAAASLYVTTCFAPIGIAFYLAQEAYFVAPQNTQTNLQLDTLEEEKENSANFTQLNVEEVLSPAEIAVVQQWPTPEQRWAYAIQQAGLSPFFQDYLGKPDQPLSENEPEDVEPAVHQAYLKLAQKEAQAFSPGDPRRIKTILHAIDLMSDIEATPSLIQLQTTLETVATDEKWLTQVRILRVQRDPNLDRQTALELLNRAKTYYLNASLSNGKAKQWSSEQLFLSENLALELSQRGAADQAQALLMHMQANVPPPENVFFNESFEHALTWIRLQQGKAQEAIHSLEQALAKPSSHKNSRLYTDLAWAQGQSGDTQAALATLKKLEENYLTTSQSNHWLTWFQPTIPPPSLIVDQLYWAEKGQDIKTLKKAKKALARLRRTEGRSLTFMAPSKKSWDTPLRQARKTTLERYQNIQ